MFEFGGYKTWNGVVGHPDQVIVNFDVDLARVEFGPCIAVALVFGPFLMDLFVSRGLD